MAKTLIHSHSYITRTQLIHIHSFIHRLCWGLYPTSLISLCWEKRWDLERKPRRGRQHQTPSPSTYCISPSWGSTWTLNLLVWRYSVEWEREREREREVHNKVNTSSLFLFCFRTSYHLIMTLSGSLMTGCWWAFLSATTFFPTSPTCTFDRYTS